MAPHVVIVGGGFGGLTATRALCKAPVTITLIDRSNHHLFQPLLYQVATASLSPADIAAPIRAILRRQVNSEVMMDEVIGVDAKERLVLTKTRRIPYDYLILATGSFYGYFGHEDWNKFAPGLKCITDAIQIRRRILTAFEEAEMESDPEKRKAFLTFVVVGAGPTGVEMAGSIGELARYALRKDFRHVDPGMTKIVLIEANERILMGFPLALAKKAQRKLESLGVEIITKTRVDHIDENGVEFEGNRVRAKTVIWAAGVVASPAGKWLQAETDRAGRVKVEPNLSLPGHPEIFVVGDTALYTQNGKSLPGVAPVAMQQGKYVAALIRRKLKGDPPLKPFRYKNKGNLATVGRGYAVAEFRKLRISGGFAWITWLFVHIYYLIGFRRRLIVFIHWMWSYFTFKRGARLITKAGDT